MFPTHYHPQHLYDSIYFLFEAQKKTVQILLSFPFELVPFHGDFRAFSRVLYQVISRSVKRTLSLDIQAPMGILGVQKSPEARPLGIGL